MLEEVLRTLSKCKSIDDIVIVSKVFNNELIQIIKKSKIIINIHYNNNALLELFRIHDLLSYDCIILSEKPINSEEFELIEKYNKVVSFFTVINYDLSNISEMYEIIDKNLRNEINFFERDNFIKMTNECNYIRRYLIDNIF